MLRATRMDETPTALINKNDWLPCLQEYSTRVYPGNFITDYTTKLHFSIYPLRLSILYLLQSYII